MKPPPASTPTEQCEPSEVSFKGVTPLVLAKKAESLLRQATVLVDYTGPHPSLTDAWVHLSCALGKLEEFIEEVKLRT